MTTRTIHRVVPFTPEQIFDVVADVERYPEFVPWWAAAHIITREDAAYYTEQIVRISLLRLRFATKTSLVRPWRIDVTSADRAFRRFHVGWTFAAQTGGRCDAGLTMTFELRSRLLQEIAAAFLEDAPARLIAAFESRARQICHKPT